MRDVHRRPVVYLRKGGDTRRQPRPRFKRTLGVDGLELSARGLFGCQGTPDVDPTATPSCELLLTDPIRVTRGSAPHPALR